MSSVGSLPTGPLVIESTQIEKGAIRVGSGMLRPQHVAWCPAEFARHMWRYPCRRRCRGSRDPLDVAAYALRRAMSSERGRQMRDRMAECDRAAVYVHLRGIPTKPLVDGWLARQASLASIRSRSSVLQPASCSFLGEIEPVPMIARSNARGRQETIQRQRLDTTLLRTFGRHENNRGSAVIDANTAYSRYGTRLSETPTPASKEHPERRIGFRVFVGVDDNFTFRVFDRHRRSRRRRAPTPVARRDALLRGDGKFVLLFLRLSKYFSATFSAVLPM